MVAQMYRSFLRDMGSVSQLVNGCCVEVGVIQAPFSC